MKNIRKLIVVMLMLVFISAPIGSFAEVVTIVNGDFESSGDGWTSQGSAFEASKSYSTTTVNASGTKMAVLTASGGNQGTSNLQSALGFNNSAKTYIDTYYSGMTDYAYTYKDVAFNEGDTFTMNWNYIATDDPSFNDGSLAFLINTNGQGLNGRMDDYYTQVTILGATTIHTANYTTGGTGSTGWQSQSYEILESGTYRIAFVSFNLDDTIASPHLCVDLTAGTTSVNGSNVDPSAKDTDPPTPPGPFVGYSSESFSEDGADDGSIASSVTLTLQDDTFTGTNGQVVDYATVSNLPTGLSSKFVKASDTTLTMTLEGNATSHYDENDISNLTVTFTDSAFTNYLANIVANSVKSDLSIDFTGTAPLEVTVSYSGNGNTGGSVPSSDTDVTPGSSVTSALNTGNLEKTGYTFSEWNTSSDGSGSSVEPGTNFTVSANTTLYAQWSADDQTLTYDSNTGTGTMGDGTHKSDASVTLTTNTFTKTGYTFTGWDTQSDGNGTDYADGASYTMPTQATTLYAQWSADSQTLTYDSNTGTGSMGNGTHNSDASVTLTTNTFTKTGYTFTGWDTQSDGNGTGYADGASYTMPTEATTLYAQWSVNNNELTYDSNTGSGSMTAGNHDSNEVINLTTNTFTKTGYTFTGWDTLAVGGGDAYADDASFTMPTADETLYAQWSADDQTLTYDSNTGTGTMGDGTHKSDASVTLTTNTFTKTGYTFTGWDTQSDGNGTDYADGASYTMPTQATTLYAQWSADSQTLTYDSNTGTGSMGNGTHNSDASVTLTTNTFTKTGYTFTGWDTQSDGNGTGYADGASYTMPTEATTLYAQWSLNSYTVSFESNGGTSVTSQNENYSTVVSEPTAPTKTGYTFVDWYVDSGFNTIWDFVNDLVGTSDFTLYADWNLNNYLVSFDVDGGTVVSSQTIDYATLVTEPSDPTRTGYIFDGWYSDESTTSIWDFSSDTVPAKNMNLYAKWDMIIDSNLSDLDVDGYALNETFASSTTYYEVEGVIEANVDITTTVLANQFSTVKLNNEAVDGSGITNVSLNNGSNVFTITVVAQDGTTEKEYTLVISKLSDVALLEELEVVDQTIDPTFNSKTTNYNVHVVSGSAITVNLLPEDRDAKIYYDGKAVTSGGAIKVTSGSAITLPINVGINPFEFDVVAVNGVDKTTYSLVVDKDNDDPKLADILVDGHTLSPTFSPTKKNYDLTVVDERILVTLKMEEYKSLKINNNSVTSGSSLWVDLDVGENEIEIDTVAENGIDKTSYTLDVYRKNDDPSLNLIKIEEVELESTYKPQILEYEAKVYTEESINIKAVLKDATKITINGNEVASNSYYSVDLNIGMNEIVIKTVSEDALHNETYIVNVYRANNVARLKNVDNSAVQFEGINDPEVTDYNLGKIDTTRISFRPYLYSEDNSTVKINGRSVNSTEEKEVILSKGENEIEIVVTAEDKVTTRTYIFKIEFEEEKNEEDKPQTTPQPEPQPEEDDTKVIVIVNGKEENAGEQSKTIEDGRVTTEVKVDRVVIEEKIKEATEDETNTENKIIIPISNEGSEKISALLTGDIVKTMEDSAFKLSVESENVEYIIPAKEVNINRVAALMDISEENLVDIEINVEIENIEDTVSEVIIQNAEDNSYEVVFPPIEFTITAKAKNKDGEEQVVEVSTFNDYVERSVEIPAGIDPEKVTTGVLYNADGTFSHIPTQVVEFNGKFFARMNSLTNSSYSVIWNPIEIDSVEGHWSEQIVNNLASRLIIDSNVAFDPESNITRGEFIEYIVKGLGIHKTGVAEKLVFTDMTVANADVLTIASEYGIVSGYPDGSIQAERSLTREEAMMILSNALRVLPDIEIDSQATMTFEDLSMVSTWASEASKEIVGKKIMVGMNPSALDPKGTLTAAQAAATIENMLKACNLINN